MKKILLTLFLLISLVGSARAYDYSYLTFETTDGNSVAINVEGLTLSISNCCLVAVDTDGSDYTFAFSNLSKMYFSTSDETTTGIEEITNAALDEATDIYDLQGHKVTKEQMRKGVYIVKTKNRTYKMVVR